MSRYIIDTHDDEVLVPGDDGIAFDTLEDARKAAFEVLPDMARDKVPNGDRRTFYANVRNEAGMVVYRATLTIAGEWPTRPTG